MPVVPIDPTDGALLEQAVAVETRATAAVRPGWVPLPASVRAATIGRADGWTVRLQGARDSALDQGRLVGVARTMVAADTPGTAWLFVDVDPSHQRRGVGTALARAAQEALPDAVTTVVAQAYRPGPDELESLVRGFARPLGFELATTETVVELALADADLPDCPAPPGHAVRTFTNGVPPALREQVGRIQGLVDADAPSGDLQWQPTPVTPEAYAAEIREWQAQGRDAVETVALTPEGAVAAWTCVVVPPNPERPADVQGTLVLAEHRGRGLGAAVKRANLVALRGRGDVQRVRTSSDDANRWMRAINDRLGFRPVEVEALLRKVLAAL